STPIPPVAVRAVEGPELESTTAVARGDRLPQSRRHRSGRCLRPSSCTEHLRHEWAVTFFETSMAALASSYSPQRFPVNFHSISCTSCRSRTDTVRSARFCAAPYTAPTDSEGAVSRTMPTTPLRGRHRRWVDDGLGDGRATG